MLVILQPEEKGSSIQTLNQYGRMSSARLDIKKEVENLRLRIELLLYERV
jgi:hypothetical protein